MNPLTNVKNTQKLNEKELELGLVGSKSSWHEDFKDSAWIFVGGLPYDLTEGDIICVFSQYGEIVNINLVRDKQSGKSKGFCFICYEDQRSTILAVDNLNAIKLLGRTLRVNHVANYKMPKEHEGDDEVTRQIREEGCAPTVMIRNNEEGENEDEEEESPPTKKHKKEKKKKKKRKKTDEAETNSEQGTTPDVTDGKSKKGGHPRIKEERHDPGYDKYSRRNERSGPSDKNYHLSGRLKEEQIKSEPEYEKNERFYNDHSSDKQRHREDDRKRGRDDETRSSRRQEDDRQHLGSHRDRDSSSELRSSRAESRTSDREYTGSEGYNKKDSDTRPSRSRYIEDERTYSGSRRGRDTGDDRSEHSNSDRRHRRDSDMSYDKMRREERYRYEYEKDNKESKRRDSHEKHYDYSHGRRRETDSGMKSHQDSRKYSETRNSEHRHSSRSEEHQSPPYRSSREYSPYSRKEKERIYKSHESRRERQRSRSPLGSYEKMKITVEIRK